MATQPVDPQLRKTGIGVVGDVPWGSHFFMFYETKEDLLDTLVPYFKAGLESGELCLWVVSEPLTEAEARNALRKAVPEFEHYLADRSIEIVGGRRFYFSGNDPDLQQVIRTWAAKTDYAVTHGYAGLRVSTNAEEALLEAQAELARVTRAVDMGELVATIAHEVNQPLTAIVTNGNFCLRRLEGVTPNLDELRAAIAEIVSDGARASAVISRIRRLLRKGAPRRTGLDINRIIQDVGILLRTELTRGHVSLRIDLAPDLPRVAGDQVQLQQVLINLIMNAVEAMRLCAERPRKLLIRSAKSTDGVLVQVQDSGPGIEPRLADRIFEPFFTTKAEGIGMGLAISHTIIESHGGHLSLASSSEGALFEFILPVTIND